MNAPSAEPSPSDLASRFSGLARRAQQLPPPGARPLTVSSRVAGWATPRATEVMAGMPGVHVEDEAVHLTAAPSHGYPLNTVLEQIAFALRDAGCLRAWRGELLDVVGEGLVLGRIERASVRTPRMLTPAVPRKAVSPTWPRWLSPPAH